MMRVVKPVILLVTLLSMVRFLPAYYSSWQFKDFVRDQTRQVKSKTALKNALLDRAKFYSLPVEASDIDISMIGAVLRVSVDYKVPVNLVVYRPEVQFHVIAAGFLPDR